MPENDTEREAYLGMIRDRVKELSDLIDAAPCTVSLARAVQMTLIVVEHFGLKLEAEAAMQQFEEARQEKLRRLFGLN